METWFATAKPAKGNVMRGLELYNASELVVHHWRNRIVESPTYTGPRTLYSVARDLGYSPMEADAIADHVVAFNPESLCIGRE